jgi:hypothetical protein
MISYTELDEQRGQVNRIFDHLHDSAACQA